jgi:hypothetical protein
MNLTPRLIAKLLTNSYVSSLPYNSDRSHIGYLSSTNPGHNAQNLTSDPDFLAINDPEWQFEALTSPALADLLLPQGRSDAAWALWSYVLADADAVHFLQGKPDPWGMIVNPWSNTDATKNLSGTALSLPTDSFPKADPVEIPATSQAGAINLVTWRPYTNDLDTSAYLTLRGDGQVLGAWDELATPPKYTKITRDLPGFQKVLGLTDTAAAARYETVSAALLNPAGNFVAPTSTSLLAAAAAMVPNATQPQVFGFDPQSAKAKAAGQAYPLALPVFAAVNPGMTDSTVRASYAAFIRYASTTGQQSGTALGQLPDGYAPIPAEWRTKAATAAAAIQAGSTSTTQTEDDTPDSGSGASFGGGSSSGDGSSIDGSTPTPTGELAGSLAGPKTTTDPKIGNLGAVVPLSVGSGLAAAIAVPIISRIRRPL